METSETLAFIADRIRRLCDESGISVNELATRSGLSPSTLDALLNCRRLNPRVATLERICNAFSITLKQFWVDSKCLDDTIADTSNLLAEKQKGALAGKTCTPSMQFLGIGFTLKLSHGDQ